MKLRKVLRNETLPHLLATFLWTLLAISLTFNLNISIAVTRASASGGQKVVMLFHIWMLFFPVLFCITFYRIRKEGVAERVITYLSVITIFFSAVNISLHFVNELTLLMKAAEVTAWIFYNGMFSASVYKVSTAFLLPLLSRFEEMEKDTRHINRKS